MKKIIVSVINDLVTDQRVHKTCITLTNMGFEVHLVGRRKRDSLPMPERGYATYRMNLFFEKGILFYVSFQLRLLFWLLRHPGDVYLANDLDTLWPNRIVSKIRRKPLVYDTHEIFTEVPELVTQPVKQKIWQLIEKMIFPQLKHVITVNASIASWYEKRYAIRPYVVRNMPRKAIQQNLDSTREIFRLPIDKKIVLLQGAGLNIHRGAEEAVLAMQYLGNVLLLIIGGGDVLHILQQLVEQYHLQDKVRFVDKMPPDQLYSWTRLADLGLTLDKDTNLNYRFSLPNKLFDYIHAGIPVLCSDLPEVRAIVEQYQVGQVIVSHEPKVLAQSIDNILQHRDYPIWKANAQRATDILNWEHEEETLKMIYSQFL